MPSLVKMKNVALTFGNFEFVTSKIKTEYLENALNEPK